MRCRRLSSTGRISPTPPIVTTSPHTTLGKMTMGVVVLGVVAEGVDDCNDGLRQWKGHHTRDNTGSDCGGNGRVTDRNG